jgi:hypothetical protein
LLQQLPGANRAVAGFQSRPGLFLSSQPGKKLIQVMNYTHVALPLAVNFLPD